MELVHLDFLTLGGKADDNRGVNILIVTDHFTKYAQAYITPKQTAVVVAQTLWKNFLVHYGWPEKILTDQGKSFENNLIKELCELARVKKLCTSPNHPDTNGQCEHSNVTLISMLGTLPTHAKKNLTRVDCHINACLQLYCVSSNRFKSLFYDVWMNPQNTLRYRNGGNIKIMKGCILSELFQEAGG